MQKCTKCGGDIHPLEVFPGNICLNCHEKQEKNKPLEKPNFTKVFNK